MLPEHLMPNMERVLQYSQDKKIYMPEKTSSNWKNWMPDWVSINLLKEKYGDMKREKRETLVGGNGKELVKGRKEMMPCFRET